jgi:DNA-directed RNA polymerase specialized sigma24 family protein
VNRAVALRGSDGPELWRLIDRCRRDDEGAWEVLYGLVRRVAGPILATFRLRGVDREEILASLWEPLMSALKRGQPTGTGDLEIAAYFRVAVRNRALNFLRARQRQPDAPARGARSADPEGDDPLDMLRCPEPGPEQRAMLEAAIRCIDGWPAEDRLIFLGKLQGVPTAEIKKALEAEPFRTFLAPATIHTRFHRLQSRLRAALGSEP